MAWKRKYLNECAQLEWVLNSAFFLAALAREGARGQVSKSNETEHSFIIRDSLPTWPGHFFPFPLSFSLLGGAQYVTSDLDRTKKHLVKYQDYKKKYTILLPNALRDSKEKESGNFPRYKEATEKIRKNEHKNPILRCQRKLTSPQSGSLL